MTASPHPDWAAVGKTVTVTRRLGRLIAHTRTDVVVRHTPTLVVLKSGERYRRGHPVDPVYYLTPQYIDCTTTITEVTP